MKAVILAGGFGTRLRPLSCTRPKILFPILNKPLLQWTFERLAKNNVNEAIMAVNYQTEVAIKQHRIPRHGVYVTYSRDPPRKPLGTGGPLKKAEKRIGHEEPFLVLNGDIFADVNYSEILKLHEEKKATATIALHAVRDPSRYGVAELAEGNRIKRFIEKPPREKTSTNLINAGTYVLSPEVFKRISENRHVSLEREIFTKLAEEGKLYGYVYDDLWMDIGKPEDYLRINKILLDSSEPPMRIKTKKDTTIRTPVAFDRHVTVGQHSTIGPYAVLGRNVTIGNDVTIQDSIILRETEISDSVSIESAIIGEGVYIGRKAQIGKGCILGDHVRIRDNTRLAERVWVCPGKEVSENVLASRNIV